MCMQRWRCQGACRTRSGDSRLRARREQWKWVWCAIGAASADDERSETVSDVVKRQIIPGGFGARSPAHDPPLLPLRRYPFPRIHPLNNLPPLILIACLLACFLGVVQSERSLLGGDPSLNYQESTKLFTAQQEVPWKSSGGSFTSFSTAFLSQFSAK